MDFEVYSEQFCGYKVKSFTVFQTKNFTARFLHCLNKSVGSFSGPVADFNNFVPFSRNVLNVKWNENKGK